MRHLKTWPMQMVLVTSLLVLTPGTARTEVDTRTGNGTPEVVSDLASREFRLSNLFAGISFGYEGSFWKPFETEDEKSNVVEYKAEALNIGRIVGEVGYKDKPLITVVYARPFTSSDKVDEMFEASSSQSHGLEKFSGGVKLDPIVDFFLPGSKGAARYIVKHLLSIRFRYTRELFWGNARVKQEALYIPLSASVSYAEHTITGAVVLNPEHSLAFKEDFTDTEISIPVYTVDIPIRFNVGKFTTFKISPHQVRLGYFDSDWERVSDSDGAILINGRPIIYEGRYRSKGAVVSVETVDVGSPGVNIDFAFRWGVDNSLQTALNWPMFFEGPVRETSVAIQVGAWYNLYFGAERNDGPFLSFGVAWSKRVMNLERESENEKEVTTTRFLHDVDHVTKVFVTLGYRF